MTKRNEIRNVPLIQFHEAGSSESDESITPRSSGEDIKDATNCKEYKDCKKTHTAGEALRNVYRKISSHSSLKRTFSWGKRQSLSGLHPNNQDGVVNKEQRKSFKIFVFGYYGVGKTALVVRYLTGRYIHEYQSSQEETYSRNVNLDGDEVKCEVTSLVKKDKDFTEKLKTTDDLGVIITFSILDRMSFYYAKHLFDEIDIARSIPIILVGTKGDMERRRCVNKTAAAKLAKDHHCSYLEVSALSDIRVNHSFSCIMRQILLRDAMEKNPIFMGSHVNGNIVKRKEGGKKSNISSLQADVDEMNMQWTLTTHAKGSSS